MKKTILAALLGLAWAAMPAQGQTYIRPNTNPFGGSPYAPYGSLYYGNPAAVGPTGTMIPGTVGGLVPQPGFGGVAVVGTPLGLGPLSILDPRSGNVTGHPVRFGAYRGYFMNPNASLNQGGALAVGAAQQGPYPDGGLSRFSTPGKRPARGKENLDGQ